MVINELVQIWAVHVKPSAAVEGIFKVIFHVTYFITEDTSFGNTVY